MGPRPCGRGNMLPTLARRFVDGLVSFNGAAALRPRKCSDPAKDRYALPQGFNGAAALRPRKSVRPFATALPTGIASMGPWPCGRGNATDKPEVIGSQRGFNGAVALRPRKSRSSAIGDHRSRSRFNGAAALRPRKCCMDRREFAASTNVLQWGRGLAAVEIRTRHPTAPPMRQASFNGAAALRPWKYAAVMPPEVCCPQCFNGAAALRPRKWGH